MIKKNLKKMVLVQKMKVITKRDVLRPKKTWQRHQKMETRNERTTRQIKTN